MTTNYFRNFPEIDYIFGNELNASKFENISIYSDVVDQVKNVVTAYEDYNIYPGERPDQVSFNLYGTTEHYWTFYLMNDKLREQEQIQNNINDAMGISGQALEVINKLTGGAGE